MLFRVVKEASVKWMVHIVKACYTGGAQKRFIRLTWVVLRADPQPIREVLTETKLEEVLKHV